MGKKVIIMLYATIQNDFYLPAFTGVVEGSTNIKISRARIKIEPTAKSKEADHAYNAGLEEGVKQAKEARATKYQPVRKDL